MRRRRDDPDDMEWLDETRDRERDREEREGDHVDMEALDDDMGPDSWQAPPTDRAYMYHLRDMTYRQIAERLHISESTARQYVRKM